MGTVRRMQPSLFPLSAAKDQVSTPRVLAKDIIEFFHPSGRCLDPCAGASEVFLSCLPAGADWCEIQRGKDFYAWGSPVDWIVGNPPYSHYADWLRQSMRIATHIVYLLPVYKVFVSGKFLQELFAWGGIVHIRRYGTGSAWGFPFGHALAAVHYQQGYCGATAWSSYQMSKDSRYH